MARVGYICASCNAFNRGTDPCEKCALEPAFARPRFSGVQIGMIDGPTSGYYGKDFPKDPTNPAKSIVPNKRAWKDYLARKNVDDVS